MTWIKTHFISLFGIGITHPPLATPAISLPGGIKGKVPGVIVEVAFVFRHGGIFIESVGSVDLRADIQPLDGPEVSE